MGQNEKLNVEYTHVPRLEAGSAESLTYLEEEGYVVIANVLSLAQSKTALTKLWDYLEALGTGINRLDANTWDDDRVAQTPNKEKYQLPPFPELNQTQLRMVGWTESEIAQLI
jgi:hypothetical protein